MTVLVTGGAGYIGSHTCVELLAQGMDVVVVDNLDNASPLALERVAQIAGKAPTFYELDVGDGVALDQVFQKHTIHCVIHFAGKKAVGESVSMPIAYYENNLGSTLTLCRVMAQNNVKRLVFSSSATVYDGANQMPLQEDAPTGHCTNPYGWTKYMCEQILTDVVRADGSWSVTLLRYFNPVGAHESGLIGEDPKGIPNNLMPFIAQTAAGRRPHLNVFGDDYDTKDGTGVRDYIHVVDLAKGHVAAIAHTLANTGIEILNLGTGTGYSVLDMVRAFEVASGASVPYVIAPRRPGDLGTCYADPSKSARILGWQAERSLEDMCRHSWHWQQKNPQGYEQCH